MEGEDKNGERVHYVHLSGPIWSRMCLGGYSLIREASCKKVRTAVQSNVALDLGHPVATGWLSSVPKLHSCPLFSTQLAIQFWVIVQEGSGDAEGKIGAQQRQRNLHGLCFLL